MLLGASTARAGARGVAHAQVQARLVPARSSRAMAAVQWQKGSGITMAAVQGDGGAAAGTAAPPAMRSLLPNGTELDAQFTGLADEQGLMTIAGFGSLLSGTHEAVARSRPERRSTQQHVQRRVVVCRAVGTHDIPRSEGLPPWPGACVQTRGCLMWPLRLPLHQALMARARPPACPPLARHRCMGGGECTRNQLTSSSSGASRAQRL